MHPFLAGHCRNTAVAGVQRCHNSLAAKDMVEIDALGTVVRHYHSRRTDGSRGALVGAGNCLGCLSFRHTLEVPQ